MGITERLHEIGRPLVAEQLAHPTVAGISRGDLDERAFRYWLEQDHLYLLDYARAFSRLAWQAPDHHLADLVGIAHSTLTEELELHRSLSGEFGADLTTKDKGPACAAYTAWLLDAAADLIDGLAAVYPCMWGYNTLGRELAKNPPEDPRYARWIDTYNDPAFTELTEKYGRMLEEADPDPARAERFFLEGMRHEVAFWDTPYT
ncbi:TenA family protein [Nocardiopsis sp. MG754419]|uniref:TenA family protein n=1 Tax=Nocardiopsis sp. MG754419 TaxID=2259865 RepID=UPI001BA9E961|nr:TenA family protein [Nocardiopsis sp. MG754419]MBR8742258.1 transcriptional regulator [Nocardiopsis sp. MG754419]